MVQEKRKYFIEKVGPMQVIQIYADGFDNLSLKEKVFAYYLCQAALAGRNISFDQIHKNALEIKELLETIVFNPKGIEIETLKKIEKYFKLFSKNNGMYVATTDSKKILPEFTFEELADSLEIAIQNDAKIELKNGENLQEKLFRLKPYIFEPDIDATLDIAVNYYDGISPEEVKEWAKTGLEKNPLNSRVVKENGEIREIVWRTGGKGKKPGMYAKELQKIIKHLKSAIPYASSAHQKKTLRSLIRHFETGDLDDFRKFNINWVKDNTAVDYSIGFIEVYFDPRSQKGHYDGAVFFIDPVQTEIVKKLAANAQYFEEKNPWDEKYKNKNINPSVSTVVNIITANGTGAILGFIGLNLPNEQFLREKYGSKSFVVKNVMDARGRVKEEKLLEEFCWDEEEIRLDKKYCSIAENAHVALHEILGHASGKVSKELVGDPADYLSEYDSALEEARAELVGLWHIFDDKLIEIGLVPNKELGEALYREYIRDAFLQLQRIPQGEELIQDHMKAHQLIVNYILDESDAIKVVSRDGKTFLRVASLEKMHEMIGKLLSEIMRIRAEGDLPAAKMLIDQYGTKINTAWRDEVIERIKGLDLPIYTFYLMPKLKLLKDKSGNPKDVKVSYPRNLIKQLFDYSQVA